MKKFKFTIGGTQYDVEVLDLEGNSVEIEVNGTKYTVEIEKEVKKVVTKTPILVRSGVPEPTRSDKKIKKVIAAKGRFCERRRRGKSRTKAFSYGSYENGK